MEPKKIREKISIMALNFFGTKQTIDAIYLWKSKRALFSILKYSTRNVRQFADSFSTKMKK